MHKTKPQRLLLNVRTCGVALLATLMAVASPVLAQSADALVVQARREVDAQNLAVAMQAVEAALSVEPNNDAALAEKARVLYFQGKKTEALAQIQQVLAINASNAVALNLRSVIRLGGKNFAGAAEDASAAIAADPQFGRAYANRARAIAQMGATQKSVMADYAKAMELEPSSIPISAEAALFCFERTDLGCTNYFDSLVALSPTASAYYGRGVYVLVRELDGMIFPMPTKIAELSLRALADFSKAQELDPAIENKTDFHRQIGQLYLYAKNHAAAIEMFDKQIARDAAAGKKDVWPYIYRSEANLMAANLDAALQDFAAIEALNPDVPQIHLGRAQVYERKRDYDAALLHYSKAVQRNPNRIALLGLANIHGVKKNYAEAEATLTRMAKGEYKSSPWLRNGSASSVCIENILRGEIALSKGNKEAASSAFYQARNASHGGDRGCLARAAYREGEMKLESAPLSAIDAFQQVVELDPVSFPDARTKLQQARDKDQSGLQISDAWPAASVYRNSESAMPRAVLAEYDTLHSWLEFMVERLVSQREQVQFWRNQRSYYSPNLAGRWQDNMGTTVSEANRRVDQFLARHGNNVPASIKAHLHEDLRNMSSAI